MKSRLTLFGLVGLAILISTTFSSFSNDEMQNPKIQRHVRIIKDVDGKKAELDTVITGGDKFVWHGDSIGGKMMVQGRLFRPGMMRPGMMGSGMNRPERFMGRRDSTAGNMFMAQRERNGGRAPMFGRRDFSGIRGMKPGGFAGQMRNRNFNDRQFRGRAPQRQFMMNGPRQLSSPQRPDMRMSGMPGRGNMIDLSDSNIISLKKKNLSGGREKIEIIREKSDGKSGPSFENFSGVNQMGSPMQSMRGKKGRMNRIRHESAPKGNEETGKEVPQEQNK